jgi:S1-C subfamily serine protease
MKRIGWFLAAVFLAAIIVPAAHAGGYGKCTLSTQECLDMMAKNLKNRGWIGVEINEDSGKMQISRILPGSPAEKAGLVAGDVLFAVSGVEYADANHEKLSKIRDDMTPGKTFTFTILKAGKDKQDIDITLAPMPEDVMAAMIGKHLLEGHLTAEKADQAK